MNCGDLYSLQGQILCASFQTINICFLRFTHFANQNRSQLTSVELDLLSWRFYLQVQPPQPHAQEKAHNEEKINNSWKPCNGMKLIMEQKSTLTSQFVVSTDAEFED